MGSCVSKVLRRRAWGFTCALLLAMLAGCDDSAVVLTTVKKQDANPGVDDVGGINDAAAVLDADALTSFAGQNSELFAHINSETVMTPHEGEFDRLFPGLLSRASSRLNAAREAAALANCVVVLKGPDTVVAAQIGRAHV